MWREFVNVCLGLGSQIQTWYVPFSLLAVWWVWGYLLLCEMNQKIPFRSLKGALVGGMDPKQTRVQVFESNTIPCSIKPCLFTQAAMNIWLFSLHVLARIVSGTIVIYPSIEQIFAGPWLFITVGDQTLVLLWHCNQQENWDDVRSFKTTVKAMFFTISVILFQSCVVHNML